VRWSVSATISPERAKNAWGVVGLVFIQDFPYSPFPRRPGSFIPTALLAGGRLRTPYPGIEIPFRASRFVAPEAVAICLMVIYLSILIPCGSSDNKRIQPGLLPGQTMTPCWGLIPSPLEIFLYFLHLTSPVAIREFSFAL